MRQVERKSKGYFAPYEGDQRISPELFQEQSFNTTLGAAFRLENDMVAAWQTLNRPDFEPDPDFDIFEFGPKSEYWNTNRDSLSGRRVRTSLIPSKGVFVRKWQIGKHWRVVVRAQAWSRL